ncbi:uncharacterized protein DS421_20g706570 [Arachis hypogaea]|nr:uncharacterized protein DS421_20g706570 [Arachis hypogaea]
MTWGFTQSPLSVFIFYTTLFFCKFDWPGEKYNNHYLNVYKENRDECRVCSWKIYRDGGKMRNPLTGKYEFNFTWNGMVINHYEHIYT